MPSANGREKGGRFAKGNPGGPGNPFARKVAALRSALFAAINEQHIQALAHVLLDKAQHGNLAAAKLLWLYTIGKPNSTVDPDTLDLHEWELYCKAPTDGAQLANVVRSMPVQMACEVLRAALPALRQAKEQRLVERIDRRVRRSKADAANPPA